jgi:hypothetical protein
MKVPSMSRLNDSIWAGAAGAAIAHLDSIYTNPSHIRYRNFLMACAALMAQDIRPEYMNLLDEPTPPGVRNLQSWIEAAWSAGSTCNHVMSMV